MLVSQDELIAVCRNELVRVRVLPDAFGDRVEEARIIVRMLREVIRVGVARNVLFRRITVPKPRLFWHAGQSYQS